MIITHSDIVSFLRCRRLFKWSVLDDWNPPEPKVGPLMLGTRVHAAIEEFHRNGVDPVSAHTALAQQARADVVDDADWVRKQLEDDILIGTNCVMAYRRWLDTNPYDGWTVAGVEVPVEVPMLNGTVTLRGRIDLLAVNDDLYMIEDVKTVAPTRVESAMNHVLRTYQHAVYAYALEQSRGATVIRSRYIHLRKVKDLSRTAEPVIVTDVPVVRRTTAQSMEYIERILLEISALSGKNEDDVWYPYPQDSCAWCAYRIPCLLATDGVDASRLLAEKFQHGIRLARYDQGS